MNDGAATPGGTADTDRLLRGVEEDLAALDDMDSSDQVRAFDRLHTSLADALARTAETGGPPGPGPAGA